MGTDKFREVGSARPRRDAERRHTGPAIIPGNARRKPAVSSGRTGAGKLQMPPGDASKRLPVEAVEAIRGWINAGARRTEEKLRRRVGDVQGGRSLALDRFANIRAVGSMSLFKPS